METVRHILLDCLKVVEVWFNSPFQFRSTLVRGDKFIDCWEDLNKIFQNISPDLDIKKMCVFMCWSIWKAMNDLVFHGSHHSPTDTVASALNFHESFNEPHLNLNSTLLSLSPHKPLDLCLQQG